MTVNEKHEEFNILFKYCYNSVNYDVFAEILKEAYGAEDRGYVDENWDKFKNDMFGFIAQRSGVFRLIAGRIKSENYKG